MGQNNITSVAPLCTKIWFDYQSGVVNYREGQSLYRTRLDGSTYILIDGMEFPVSGCPIPEKVFWANIQYFFVKNSKIIIPSALIVVLSVVAQWLLWLIPDSPLVEMKWNFISIFSFWMNTILFLTALWAFGGWFVYRFWPLKYVYPEVEQDVFSLGKDILIYTEEGETREQFAARAIEAQKNIKAGIFVVVIPFQNSGGVVIRKGENEKTNPFDSFPFLRENPPYQTPDFSGETERKGFRFSEETFSEYRNYLARFCFYFPEYAKTEKIKLGMEGHLEQILEF